jgi:hypothetical protein
MKKMNSNILLEQLQADTRQMILQCGQLEGIPDETLGQPPGVGKWSVAQILEHLNVYARYYLEAIELKLHLNHTLPRNHFSPGWWGNYFTSLMKPTANRTLAKTMKAPKNAVPSAFPDAREMLQEFIQHQHRLLNLLQIAKTVNIGRVRIATSLTKLITLKLGDTFRFFIAHEQRHFLQIEKTFAGNSAQKTQISTSWSNLQG